MINSTSVLNLLIFDSFILLTHGNLKLVTTLLAIHVFCLLTYFKRMFHLNIPRENIYLKFSGVTKVEHWFKMSESKTFFRFCSRFKKTLIWKIWLVYSDNIICSWLFLEAIPSTIYLQTITNRWCPLEFRAHQKFDFLYKKS